MESTYGQFGSDNYCEHVKESQSYFNNTYVYKTDNTPSTPSEYYLQTNRLLHLEGAALGKETTSIHNSWFESSYPGLNPYNVPWRDNFAKGFSNMWPKIEKQMDETLGNFTFEIPTTGGLAEAVAKRIQRIAHVVRFSANRKNTLRTLLRDIDPTSSKGGLIRSIIGGTARANLAWEFGVRPLIEDVVAIHNSFVLVRKDIDRLLKAQNRILRSHWSCNVPISTFEDRSHTRGVGGMPAELLYYYLNAYVLRAKYTCSMKYSYVLSEYAKRHSTLLGFLDAYGIGGMGNPQMLWDALPFSFVIDYFAHVGKFLDQFSDRGIQPSVTVMGLSHSYSLQYTRDMHMQVLGAHGSNSGRQLAHVKNVSYYIRERPWRGQVSGITTRGFSKYNVRMLGTLIAALKVKA